METKYYTPEIEEFHFGFEYEVSNYLVRKSLAITLKEEWYKKVFNDEHPYRLEWLNWLNKHGTLDNIVRVKYLDEEDILSLGFKKERIISFEDGEYNEYVMALGTTAIIAKAFDIFLLHRKTRIIINCVDNKQDRFNGIIRNKSELIRLLKQLRIL